jgi:hypothetical protein
MQPSKEIEELVLKKGINLKKIEIVLRLVTQKQKKKQKC